MASKHQYLTNEEFSQAYDNKFELALQIIHMAQVRIQQGDDVALGRLLNEMRKEAHQKIEENKTQASLHE